MIQFRDVHLRLKGRPVLRGFDLKPAPGQLSLLAGSNGVGKSSALKVAAGLWRPGSGSVVVNGEDLHARKRKGPIPVAYLPQSPNFHPRLRVRNLLLFYARIEGGDQETAENVLERFGLQAHADYRSAELSGGLRQRLGLAVLALSPARVWLIDEPGLSLDPYWRNRLQSWLRELCAQGRTILVATHLLAEWEGRADACYLCENGRIADQLDPDALRSACLRVESFGSAEHASDRTSENRRSKAG
ncbi:MAG: ATP-binding cassette domain-containing protein [Opitutales bacterium]